MSRNRLRCKKGEQDHNDNMIQKVKRNNDGISSKIDANVTPPEKQRL